MQILQPSVTLRARELDASKLLTLEEAGRMCYQSEGQSNVDTFLGKRLKDGHESIIEHEKVTAIFVCDRGVSHEIVRHRLAAYSQESTRYCNYSHDKFGREIAVIDPFFFSDKQNPLGSFALWKQGCEFAESTYFSLLDNGASPQEARSVLPNSLKTQIMVTYNLREWRHFFKLRCAKAAHPQMRQLTIPLLLVFQKAFPVLFADIKYDEDFPAEYYAEVIINKA